MGYKEEVITTETELINVGTEAPIALIKTITYVPRTYHQGIIVSTFDDRELDQARDKVRLYLADMLSSSLKYHEVVESVGTVKSYIFSVSILMDKEKNDLLDTINYLKKEVQIGEHKVDNYRRTIEDYKEESLWAMIKRWRK